MQSYLNAVYRFQSFLRPAWGFLPYSRKPFNKRQGCGATNTQMAPFSAEPTLGFPSHLSEQKLHSWLDWPVPSFRNNRWGSVAATVLFSETHVWDCTSSFPPDRSSAWSSPLLLQLCTWLCLFIPLSGLSPGAISPTRNVSAVVPALLPFQTAQWWRHPPRGALLQVSAREPGAQATLRGGVVDAVSQLRKHADI